jgi:hypothetical protein
MNEMVREQSKGWTYIVGSLAIGGYVARIESPGGEVTTKGPFVSDNEARVAMAEARNRVNRGEEL